MHGRRRTSRISMSSSRGSTPGSSATTSCLAQGVAHMTHVSATNRKWLQLPLRKDIFACAGVVQATMRVAVVHDRIHRTRRVFRGQHGAAVTGDTHEEADPIRVVEQKPPRHQLVQQTPKAPDVAGSTCSCKGACR